MQTKRVIAGVSSLSYKWGSYSFTSKPFTSKIGEVDDQSATTTSSRESAWSVFDVFDSLGQATMSKNGERAVTQYNEVTKTTHSKSYGIRESTNHESVE